MHLYLHAKFVYNFDVINIGLGKFITDRELATVKVLNYINIILYVIIITNGRKEIVITIERSLDKGGYYNHLYR